MQTKIVGNAFKVGDDINTDYIIPARYLDVYEPAELGIHAFEGLDKDAPRDIRSYRIVVAGENFGSGSAREQAPNALKGAGIKVIIAKSFARIFYRNSINVGIVSLHSPEAVETIDHGEKVIVDLTKNTIACQNGRFDFPPFPKEVADILRGGGLFPYLQSKIGKAIQRGDS